jgi:hypothetical protein
MTTRVTILSLVLALPILTGASAVQAGIVVDGTPAFKDEVKKCLDKIRESEVDPAFVLSELEKSAKTTTIRQTPAKVNRTGYSNTNDANSPAAGGTGNGTDTNIDWNPTNFDNEEAGTRRDPCASLMHELRHAFDGANGTRDPRVEPPPPAPNGIKHNEIEASREENLYRKKHPPLPQRRQYGGRNLPPHVIF